jgi:hypothetical protein
VAVRAAIPLYYFDIRDDDRLPDDEGTRLAGGVDAARIEAFAALTDYAREITPTATCRRVAVEVCDENSRLLLKAVLILEFEVLTRP